MYKVFVNDIPIILSTEKEIGNKYTSIPIKEAKIKKLIGQIEDGKLFYVNLFHKNEKKLLKHLRKKVKTIVAGGGMVFNDNKEILFIKRKGRWDLPKGKAENGEKIEWTAMREVEEETGVKDLQIVRFLKVTYHILKRGGEYKLKETHWFEMHTSYQGELVPQKNEEITKVKWKDFEKSQKALQKSYENIKLLFPKEYLNTNLEDKE